MSSRTAEPTGKRIYVVEDDADVARLIRLTLQDFGFDIAEFRTAAELLRRVERQAPDLCIVDLGLPDMDGMDLVRLLRERHDCGLLILTGRGYVGDRVMGLELGADDYVAKPFDPRELVARVRSILRRTAAAAAQQHRFGIARFAGWRFNTGNNILVSESGKEWHLSTAEAQLLKVFITHPNRILSREQLLAERGLSPFDRSIDVRVSRLRRKLEADPQNPKLIRTVYGAGYLFAADTTWE